MIFDLASLDGDLRVRADVCVIGSGAGGSVVAHDLAAAGRSVVVLEEGRYWTSRDFDQLEEDMYLRLYRQRGTQPTADFTVLVSQGRALGGSTLVGFCLCFRPSRHVLEYWRAAAGLRELSHENLFPHVERIERILGARPMGPEELNENNRLLLVGSERLGYRGHFVRHNRTDCLGCGFCALGCAYDRKGDALTRLLTPASARGARIFPDVRVERILHERGQVRGVEGRARRSRTGAPYRVVVEAPTVVLAAGAIESPLLWLRSGLPDRPRLVGRNLRLNPYAVVAGIFPDPVRSWQGVPQSYIVDEFLALDRSVFGGFLMLAAAAPPLTAASLIPGFGAAHRRVMDAYERMAGVGFLLNERTVGRVRMDRQGAAVIEYRLTDDDKRDVMRALRAASDVLFAAGAESVVLPYNDLVELRARKEASVIEQRGILLNDPLFVSFQPQGTLRMGADPVRSVVRPDGRAHAVRGLYVADASLLPTSVGVPPQIAVMALASRIAENLLAEREA